MGMSGNGVLLFMDDDLTNEQRVMIYQLFLNYELLKAYWTMREKTEQCQRIAQEAIESNKRTRKKVDKLINDLGVAYQVIFEDYDNDSLTLEDYKSIVQRIQRFVTPYVVWWRKKR